MNIIVAADKNWAIGKDNKLLVSIPADMKMFRQETTGKVVVMGRKTLESFPNGLPLKNRTKIVLKVKIRRVFGLHDRIIDVRTVNFDPADKIVVFAVERLISCKHGRFLRGGVFRGRLHRLGGLVFGRLLGQLDQMSVTALLRVRVCRIPRNDGGTEHKDREENQKQNTL